MNENNSTTTPSPVLTTAEAAAYIGQSPRTMERWRLVDTGPAYTKHGYKRVRYLRADLDAWLSAGRVVPGEAA